MMEISRGLHINFPLILSILLTVHVAAHGAMILRYYEPWVIANYIRGAYVQRVPDVHENKKRVTFIIDTFHFP